MDELTPTLVEGELRIRDVDLGARLGFANPIDIRKLIRRYAADLGQMGVLASVAKAPDSQGGRPAIEFYLNRRQAIFITAKPETAEATDTTIEVIERFDANERGDIDVLRPDHAVLTPDDRSAVGGIIKRVVANQIRPLLQMRRLTTRISSH
jgi:hypothetical protein